MEISPDKKVANASNFPTKKTILSIFSYPSMFPSVIFKHIVPPHNALTPNIIAIHLFIFRNNKTYEIGNWSWSWERKENFSHPSVARISVWKTQ